MQTGESPVTIAVVDPANLADDQFALALALRTIGIKPHPTANGGDVCEFREKVGDRAQRRFVFVFMPEGTDGADTATWVKRWEDPSWLAQNRNHPFTAMREFSRSFGSFAEWMATHEPLLVFRRSDGVNTTPDGKSQTRIREAVIPASQLETDRGREILQKAGIQA